MPGEQPNQDALHQEANRLYWESGESVNQIGEALGLSKGVLYGLIAPLPAGLPCPSCGKEMAFPNRTAREKGFLACPGCGMEEEEAAVQEHWEGAAERGAGGVPQNGLVPPPQARPAAQASAAAGPRQAGRPGPRGRALAGAALLGMAAGLLIGRFLHRP